MFQRSSAVSGWSPAGEADWALGIRCSVPYNGSGGGRTWWAHVEFTRMNIDVITTLTSSRSAARRLWGVHARHARIEGGRDEVDRLRLTCEPAIDCDVGLRHRRSDREDAKARRGGRPGILRLHSAAGRRGDRSDGLDGLVSAVDGGARDRVPRGASCGNSKGGDAPAETRSA